MSVGAGEDGVVATGALTSLCVGLLLGILLLDVAAYLAAAGRAQNAADAAALAAVTPARPSLGPAAAATSVADANGARLERCRCRPEDAEVEVSVPVTGLVVPGVAGVDRLHATAEATLTPASGAGTPR